MQSLDANDESRVSAPMDAVVLLLRMPWYHQVIHTCAVRGLCLLSLVGRSLPVCAMHTLTHAQVILSDDPGQEFRLSVRFYSRSG